MGWVFFNSIFLPNGFYSHKTRARSYFYHYLLVPFFKYFCLKLQFDTKSRSQDRFAESFRTNGRLARKD